MTTPKASLKAVVLTCQRYVISGRFINLLFLYIELLNIFIVFTANATCMLHYLLCEILLPTSSVGLQYDVE